MVRDKHAYSVLFGVTQSGGSGRPRCCLGHSKLYVVVPMANIVWGTPGGRCTLVVPAANGVVDCL